MRWFVRIVVFAGLLVSLVLVTGLVTWGQITCWGQSAVGRAELRARLGIALHILTANDPQLYAPWIGAQMEEPLAFHNQNGELVYWKFLFRRGDRIIGFVDIDAQSMILRGHGSFYIDPNDSSRLNPNDLSRCPQRFPDPLTAEEALDRARDLLSARYPGAAVDTPFLFGRPEFWLIRVRHGEEVIAWIVVWEETVWELPPAFYYWEH